MGSIASILAYPRRSVYPLIATGQGTPLQVRLVPQTCRSAMSAQQPLSQDKQTTYAQWEFSHPELQETSERSA